MQCFPSLPSTTGIVSSGRRKRGGRFVGSVSGSSRATGGVGDLGAQWLSCVRARAGPGLLRSGLRIYAARLCFGGGVGQRLDVSAS